MSNHETKLQVKRFKATDNDVWYSVYDASTGELSTCVMHSERRDAIAEMRTLEAYTFTK